MARVAFFARDKVAWQRFTQLLDQLDEHDMTESKVVGEWTVKDILAHIGTWQGRATDAIQLLVAGQRIERIEDFDKLNAEGYERDKDMTLEAARNRFVANHARLMAFLESLTEEQLFGSKLMQLWVNNATASHLEEHAGAIEEWIARRRGQVAL